MRFSDAMKPALDRSEAAMLPARTRTLSRGAALQQLPRLNELSTAAAKDITKEPASAAPAPMGGPDALRRAAYHSVRMRQRANS